MTSPVTIRPMRRADLDIALDWAKTEGWNPGLDDAEAFYAADPTGFLMGWDGDRPVSSISVVKSGADFGFLGLYIVHPDYRGFGHGKAIWDAGIASLRGRTIGLDGVVAQQENYRRSGFVFAHKTIRFGGKAQLGAAPLAIQQIGPKNIGAVMVYDSGHYPGVRQSFLQHWLTTSRNRRALVWSENGIVRGYAVMRKSVDGHKIGPLFADDSEIAAGLLAALGAGLGEENIYLDVPEPNRKAVELAEAIGLKPVFETARMYLGPPPPTPLHRIFGSTTLELG